ncbi:MAG: hypothetical protein K6T86_20575 [Pirellulales bacterium]|nr:hypothetical protein [Pirellulales bacterium]
MWSVFPKYKPRSALRKPRLGRFERLESRWCPAAPTITSFVADVGPGRSVTLRGQVSDENPGMVMVQFTGAVSATVYTNPRGQFTYSTQNVQLGTVTAKARDMQMLWSQPVTADITSNPPVFQNVTVVESGPNRQVTISGHITDEDPGELWVVVTGRVNAYGNTDENGNFSITSTSSELGEITVTVLDPWALEDVTTVTITSNAPSITNLTVTHESLDYYLIQGTVNDEFAPGLTVFFGGVLQGESITVNSQGIFQITVYAPDGGEANAYVYDWWGIQSELVWFTIP